MSSHDARPRVGIRHRFFGVSRVKSHDACRRLAGAFSPPAFSGASRERRPSARPKSSCDISRRGGCANGPCPEDTRSTPDMAAGWSLKRAGFCRERSVRVVFPAGTMMSRLKTSRRLKLSVSPPPFSPFHRIALASPVALFIFRDLFALFPFTFSHFLRRHRCVGPVAYGPCPLRSLSSPVTDQAILCRLQVLLTFTTTSGRVLPEKWQI